MGLSYKITDIATGKTVASTWAITAREAWICVEPDITAWYDAGPDEVGIDDTDDGDLVAVDGKRVARIEFKYAKHGSVS